jgi:hypothetical protein
LAGHGFAMTPFDFSSARHPAGCPEGILPSEVRAGPPHDSRRDGGATKFNSENPNPASRFTAVANTSGGLMVKRRRDEEQAQPTQLPKNRFRLWS